MAPQPDDYTPQLLARMQQVELSSFKALSLTAQVSLTQIKALRQGQLQKMSLSTLIKLSHALQITLFELLKTFGADVNQAELQLTPITTEKQPEPQIQILRQEYDRLQKQLAAQAEHLEQEFQHRSIQILESWLLQWPTAAHAAQQNPQVPAVRLLPLLRPVETLLQFWGVVAIAVVGAEVDYDPQYHQLMEGQANPGDRVRVRYTGYQQGATLLYRAKVSPLKTSSS